MKLIYISPSQIPSKAAHSVHIVKMCEAFAKNGHEVTLINPTKAKRSGSIEEIFEYYNVTRNFNIKNFKYLKVKGGNIINPLRLVFWLITQKKDLLICRDVTVAAFAAFFGLKVIYDAHKIVKKKGLEKQVILNLFRSKNLVKLTVVASKMKEIYESMGVAANKVFIIRNGTSEVTDKSAIPCIVNNGYFNVGYVGHLYAGKGMEVIEQIAPHLTNTCIHIVGGMEQDIDSWKKKINLPNVVFHGFIPQSRLSSYINSFDVCLLPNQEKVFGFGNRQDIGDITCPLKMFDYMAHKKAIIASDLPVLHEVLNTSTAVFCDSRNSQEWIEAIQMLRSNKELRESIANNAYELFKEQYNWQKRAQKIMEGV